MEKKASDRDETPQVRSVGLDEDVIRKKIREQENSENKPLDIDFR